MKMEDKDDDNEAKFDDANDEVSKDNVEEDKVLLDHLRLGCWAFVKFLT